MNEMAWHGGMARGAAHLIEGVWLSTNSGAYYKRGMIPLRQHGFAQADHEMWDFGREKGAVE